MTKQERIEMLVSLGYRHLGKDQWGKPWGPSLMVIDLVANEIKQIFHTPKGEVKVWASSPVDTELNDETDTADVGVSIMRFETTSTHQFEYWGKHFCFVTPEQRAEMLVDGR